MAPSEKSKLSKDQKSELLETLQSRFEKFKVRHKNIEWESVRARLEKSADKLHSLHAMEETGGEPDVIGFVNKTGEYIFCDCSKESPAHRRSYCYDRKALEARKKFPPENNVLDVAANMGIEILDESQYRELQKFGPFDTKTSSWIKTPDNIRKLGGALFSDYRYGTVFVYHNGADSYYAARGFRGILKV